MYHVSCVTCILIHTQIHSLCGSRLRASRVARSDGVQLFRSRTRLLTTSLKDSSKSAAGMADDLVAAVGVMSSVGSSGQANAGQYLARRMHLRDSLQHIPSAGRRIQMRFLMAQPKQSLDAAPVPAWIAEQRQYNDIFFLAINESRFNCAAKPLLWYAHGVQAFPTARFYAIADDDTYLQLAHMEADLLSLGADAAGRLILWGLVMWYGVYDNVTMVTHEAWGGWGYTDAGASKLRRRIERCQRSTQSSPHVHGRMLRGVGRHPHRAHDEVRDPCVRLPGTARATISRGGLSDEAPWPVVNGPLFAVSNQLARLLLQDPGPPQYLEALHQTSRVKAALSRVGGPRKSNFGCWPVYDTIFGLWVTRLSRVQHVNIELVNTPFMVQHHPWPATIHGAISNSSIVLHGLKKEKNQLKFQALAKRRALGPFIPFHRKCGSCSDMGWSNWPGSIHGRWTCCGCDANQETKGMCDQRMGQRPLIDGQGK